MKNIKFINNTITIKNSFTNIESKYKKFPTNIKLNNSKVETLNFEDPLISEPKFNKINSLENYAKLAKVLPQKNYNIDQNGNVSLTKMHPKLQNKINLLIEKCEKEGINIKITETIRTIERQNELYNKGRTTSGNIVTNAKGSDYSSKHQWGIAFDICINEKNDPYNEEKLNKVGEIGKSLGLEWGGDWTTIKDSPHFQLKGYDNINKIYKDPSEFVNDNWGEKLLMENLLIESTNKITGPQNKE